MAEKDMPRMAEAAATEPPHGEPIKLSPRARGYQRFREALLDGRIQLGAAMTQASLGIILGMSLSPLRETMTLLQQEGLITVRKRSGVQVFSPSVDFFRANFQMRTLIEKEAIRRHAKSAPSDLIERQIGSHENEVVRLAGVDNPKDSVSSVARLEADFHFSIADAFENPIITEVHRKAYSNMQLFRLAHPVPLSLHSQSAALAEHLVVLRECRRRDADAAHEALDQHFRSVMSRVFGA